MANQVGNERVLITHPGTKGETKVSRRAFEQVWKDKGWTLVNKDTNKVTPPPADETGI